MKFTQRGSLNKHVKGIHEGQKFKCDTCNNTFTAKQHLRFHNDTVHEGIKPYKCENCGMTFGRSGHLKKGKGWKGAPAGKMVYGRMAKMLKTG